MQIQFASDGGRPALDKTDPVSWASPGLILGISPAISYGFAANQAVSSRDRRGNAGVGE
jgi:hypothetical protein